MTTNLDLIKKSIQKTKAYKAISKNFNYRACKGYPTTKNIAANLAAQVIIAEQYQRGELSKELAHTATSTPTQIFLYAAKKAEAELVPCYWLASELAESLIETDIPDNWTGLKPFINRGFLLLPQNCIEYSGFGETESIDWLYFEVMIFPPELRNDIGKHSLAPDGDAGSFLNTPDKPVILWTSSSDRLSVFYGTINLTDSILSDDSILEKDKKIVERVNKLLLNTMLVLNYKPELLDKQKSESKGIGFGNAGKLPSNLSRNPVWIGKVYPQERINRHQSNRLIRDKREHYRRGHWARRRHGTREKWQYKWHWIEPTVVNHVD